MSARSNSAKSAVIQEMIQSEDKLARGSGQITLKLNEESAAAVLAHFLRSYRGRVDHAKVVAHPGENDFSERLETIRHFLFEGDLKGAESVLTSIHCADELESSELMVEKCRLLAMQGSFAEAVDFATGALSNPALCELSRMTCFQIRGHCKIMLQNHRGAIDDLQRAIALSEVFSQARSGFAAKGFLIQAHALCGEKKIAGESLASLKREVDALPSDELWLERALTLIRSETHYARAFESKDELTAKLLEAREISTWLGDLHTAKKSSQELCEIGFSAESPEFGDSRLRELGIHKFAGWMFLSRHSALLCSSPKGVTRLGKSPVMEKAIRLMVANPLAQEHLFEQIWNLKYDAERHAVHVRANLSKLRKLLPEGALVVKSGIISLI